MKPPHRSSSPSPQDPGSPDPQPPHSIDLGADEELTFEQSLEEVERSLQALKERYTQVQQDQDHQANLQQRLSQVQQEFRRTHLPALKSELRRIKEQLDTLELNLESRLLSWNSLREPFWQAVRFGGLGIVVGWLLKSCAG